MVDEPLKYIIVKHNRFEIPITFPTILTHSDVGKGWQVVSAGFCRQLDEDHKEYSAYGESISLNLKSRPETDSRELNYWMNKQDNWYDEQN